MSLSTLTQALPIVAAAYGRKFNIPVQVGGEQARTDGRTIQIPTIPETPDGKTLAFGYLAHEAGHIRFTDFDVDRHTTPLGRCIENILEDVRIEQAMIQQYPGTRTTLDAVVETLIAEGTLSPVRTTSTPAEILANGLLALARYHTRQQSALMPHAQTADQVMRQVLGSRFVHRLQGLMTEIPTLTNTAETIALARRIVALMEQEAQPEPEEPENPGHTDGTASEDEPEAPEGQNLDQGSESQAPHPEENTPDDQDQDSECEAATPEEPTSEETTTENPEPESGGSDSQGAGGTASASSTEPAERFDIKTALQSALDAGEDQLPEDLFQTVAETLGEQSGYSPVLLPSLEAYSGDAQQGRSTLNRVKVHSAKLTTRLQALIESQTLEKPRAAKRGRALSAAHLHRAGVGDPRIFRLKDHKTAPNTALHLLIDLSGSMTGGQDVLALEAAMALALALEPIKGVSRAVTAFPSVDGLDEKVTRLLAHGERVVTRAGAFVQRGRGSTPMTGALWYAAADLLARPETRKVILTLTDGIPDDSTSTAKLIKQATAAGLQMIGVGIELDVSRLFPIAIRLNDIADLKTELFHITEQLLLA